MLARARFCGFGMLLWVLVEVLLGSYIRGAGVHLLTHVSLFGVYAGVISFAVCSLRRFAVLTHYGWRKLTDHDLAA